MRSSCYESLRMLWLTSYIFLISVCLRRISNTLWLVSYKQVSDPQHEWNLQTLDVIYISYEVNTAVYISYKTLGRSCCITSVSKPFMKWLVKDCFRCCNGALQLISLQEVRQGVLRVPVYQTSDSPPHKDLCISGQAVTLVSQGNNTSFMLTALAINSPPLQSHYQFPLIQDLFLNAAFNLKKDPDSDMKIMCLLGSYIYCIPVPLKNQGSLEVIRSNSCGV